jgi:hypothetical protein
MTIWDDKLLRGLKRSAVLSQKGFYMWPVVSDVKFVKYQILARGTL